MLNTFCIGQLDLLLWVKNILVLGEKNQSHNIISIYSFNKESSLGLWFNYCLGKSSLIVPLSSKKGTTWVATRKGRTERSKVILYLVNCDDVICNDSKQSYVCWPADKKKRENTLLLNSGLPTDRRMNVSFRKAPTSTWLFDCRAVGHPLYDPAVAWYTPSDRE